MEDLPSPPASSQDAGIEISDYATFQASSPAALSPSAHTSSTRHSFEHHGEGADMSRLSLPYSTISTNRHDEHYTSSTPVSDGEDGGDIFQDDPAHISASSRSSISSLPASVLPDHLDDLHMRSPRARKETVTRDTFEDRVRSSPFRHPSSVRAMQMNDEELTPPSKRRNISRMSGISSVSSSPSKRGGKRSLQGSPQKQPKPKKEYPLVLLHCTLLPPSLPLPAGVKITDQRLLRDLLPEPYGKRWKLLQDRVGGASTVQDRGILIPHPQGDYDLLEERILESLELVKPKVRNGHFLGADGVIDEEEGEEDGDNKCSSDQCPDCGHKVVRDFSYNQTWEVKVYAANGLMRAGAWTAAWKEMERIDVEVGIWLSEDAKVEFEQRLAEHGFSPVEVEESFVDEPHETEEDMRRREVYGDAEQPHHQTPETEVPRAEEMFNDMNSTPREGPESTRKPQHQGEPDFQTLLANYIMLLFRDPKNVAIAVLSVFVLLFALSPSSAAKAPAAVVEVIPTPALSVTECVPLPPSSLQAPIFVTTTVTAPAVSIVVQEEPQVKTETVTVMAEDAQEIVVDEDKFELGPES